jgi:peptidoglycan hydrolase-like protein with peptidoglycan-binding domain
MNRATRNALRNFQKQEGLFVNGIAGPETEKALLDAKASQAGRTSGEYEYLEFDFTNLELEEEISRKSRKYVRWIQLSLNKVLKIRLRVDGIIGRNTRSAVRSFQRAQGLVVDGIVGTRTEKALIAAGASSPLGTPSTGGVPRVSTNSFLVGGMPLTPPTGLNITNYIDSSVHRFHNKKRSSSVVNEFIVHETVTRSVSDTVQVLNKRGLGVHFIMGADGKITQHGDLLDDLLWHASQHNPVSVGIEVVNPYYPKYLKDGMPWTKIINAGWAHNGRYVVPTSQQAEAVTRLIAWITSSKAKGLSIPRKWIGLQGNKLAMEQVSGADKRSPGVYAHSYFNHADGSWLILYAYLRIEKGRTPSQAYNEAIRLATTPDRFITVPKI